MPGLRLLVSSVLAAACAGALAQPAPEEDRQRMCNLQATERQLKGEARAEFVADCIRRAEKLAAHQEERKRRSAAAGR